MDEVFDKDPADAENDDGANIMLEEMLLGFDKFVSSLESVVVGIVTPLLSFSSSVVISTMLINCDVLSSEESHSRICSMILFASYFSPHRSQLNFIFVPGVLSEDLRLFVMIAAFERSISSSFFTGRDFFLLQSRFPSLHCCSFSKVTGLGY